MGTACQPEILKDDADDGVDCEHRDFQKGTDILPARLKTRIVVPDEEKLARGLFLRLALPARKHAESRL